MHSWRNTRLAWPRRRETRSDDHTRATSSDDDDGSPISISVQNVCKWYYAHGRPLVAIDSVTFDVAPGAFVGVIGPSGCGKTTVLDCVSGKTEPDSGKITIGPAGTAGRSPKMGLHHIGYVTQKDTLLPWRTILDNVKLPLLIRGVDPQEASNRALEAIKLVGLFGFERYHSSELSGGMAKRAALARTLVYEPAVLLMDEPFGNLDSQTKLQMQRELLQLWNRDRRTVMFVTHDLEEAIALCDRVVVMATGPGRVKQEVTIDLPRPRDPVEIRFEPSFQKMHRQLWELMDLDERFADGR